MCACQNDSGSTSRTGATVNQLPEDLRSVASKSPTNNSRVWNPVTNRSETGCDIGYDDQGNEICVNPNPQAPDWLTNIIQMLVPKQNTNPQSNQPKFSMIGIAIVGFMFVILLAVALRKN